MSEIAKKHIDISIKTKQIATLIDKGYHIYIATYTTGKTGKCYQQIEEASGEDFWSIKAWTRYPHPHRLKDPDIIITHADRVRFLIEVKWGTVPDCGNTDLLIGQQECDKMRQLLRIQEFICRVRGPAVWDKRRYKTTDFQISETYRRNSESKFVLVSDFSTMHQVMNSEFLKFIRIWKSKIPEFLIADINVGVSEIPSLRDILAK